MDESQELFEAEPANTQEAIMKATYDALAKHGYADLTIQRIGDEFEKSKSLLYHHYEGKDALLVDFLAFMLERMESDIPLDETETAREELQTGIEHVFGDIIGEDATDFNRAMMELRAQAAHDDDYREQFAKNDEYFASRVAEIIEAGVEEGVFREVDPDGVASMMVTIITGAMFRQATTNDPDLDAVEAEVDAYIRTRLLAEDAD